MTMTLLTADAVVAEAREGLGLPAVAASVAVDDTLLAQVLRAVAWSHCPCQPFILMREAERHLNGLVPPATDLADRLSAVLEALIATGDLVEPGQVTQAEFFSRGALFPAPPSFAMLSQDVAQLFGLANEGGWGSLPDLPGRVGYDGASRRIVAKPGEELAAKLRAAGLRELSVKAWLKEPPTVSAADLLSAALAKMKLAEPGDAIGAEMEVFVAGSSIYSKCWVRPSCQSGNFIAKRAKAFGAAQWMLVSLDAGRPLRLAHLPSPGSSLRACDEAWRLQLAKDAVDGRPQAFRLTLPGKFAHFDLTFPIPQWAHRRMLAFGRQVPSRKCICSYDISEGLVAEASSFLEQQLWMKKTTS
jgi:hypothetical protein